ncbi:hypothetical protein ACET3Z_029740 [Daucus carota]
MSSWERINKEEIVILLCRGEINETFDFGANESDEEDDDDVKAAVRKLGYVAVAIDAPTPIKQLSRVVIVIFAVVCGR